MELESTIDVVPWQKQLARKANRAVYWLANHWGVAFGVGLLLLIGLPWLAPVFMYMGWTNAGKAIHLIYNFLCHQMPQRSFFLFGEKTMYSLAEIQDMWRNTSNPLILREFVGNAQMGWKVAWSDRMVSMYGALLLFGIPFWFVRDRLKPLSLKIFALLLLPMFIDGSTHIMSDMLAGVGDGFRYHNEWLAIITGHIFAPTFYVGDAWGSFNSWMRLSSGLFFGLGVVWLTFPYLHEGFINVAHTIEAKFERAGIPL